MKRGDPLYSAYLSILEEELRPAMGCTEPIALAYAGAKARQVLGKLPEKVEIFVSGNIIKNVKSVIVPNTGGLHGIIPAVSAGIVAGNADKVLEVISCVTDRQRQELQQFIREADIQVKPAQSELVFDIDITLSSGEDRARLRLANHHTNIVHIEKNGQVLHSQKIEESPEDQLTDKSCLSIERIVEFVDLVDISQVEELVANYDLDIKVAVMGCIVNGPGEAREADLGVAGGIGEGLLFKKGQIIRKMPESELLAALKDELDHWNE